MNDEAISRYLDIVKYFVSKGENDLEESKQSGN